VTARRKRETPMASRPTWLRVAKTGAKSAASQRERAAVTMPRAEWAAPVISHEGCSAFQCAASHMRFSGRCSPSHPMRAASAASPATKRRRPRARAIRCKLSANSARTRASVWRRMMAAPFGSARAAANGLGSRCSSVIRIKGGRPESFALSRRAALASFARAHADAMM